MAKSKTLTITYLNGDEVEVTAGPKAQVMAERHFGHSLLDMTSVEEAYYLGWCALTVAGKYDKDYDTFLDVLDDVDIPQDEKDKLRVKSVHPTRPGQPSGIL